MAPTTVRESFHFWVMFAMIDAALFGATEIILFVFVLWQNLWSFSAVKMRSFRTVVGVACAAGLYLCCIAR